MAIVTAVALLVLYGMSLPAVVDYVTFMKVQSTAYLKIRFDWLYSIYVDLRRRRARPLRLDPAGGRCAARARGLRPDQGELRRLTPPSSGTP